MSRPPPEVEEGLVELMSRLTGRSPRILDAHRMGGGCINAASRVRLDSGEDVFLKWNADCPRDFFEAEARGLEVLAESTSLRVPAVLGVSDPDQPGPGWLALEYVPPGRPAPDYDLRLGAGLAALHRAGQASRAAFEPGSYGWERDNYIGSLPQPNDPSGSWADFWRDSRLRPQLDRARARIDSGDLDSFDRLFDSLDRILEPVQAEGPSLLHGDLWSGNVYPGPEGGPVLVDPAVYRGHREVDLAMTELFGGFSAAFREAYANAWPMGAGDWATRRAVYQLYPLLVHINLFGRSYLDGMRQALEAC